MIIISTRPAISQSASALVGFQKDHLRCGMVSILLGVQGDPSAHQFTPSKQFGRVETGRNPSSMEAFNGISSARPSSHHWIARCGVTAAAYSQVTA